MYRIADRTLSFLETMAAIVAGAFLLAAMVIVSADAAMRYLFARPLTFQFALTENYLLVGLILMALPWGFRTGGYIRIETLPRLLPPPLGAGLIRLGLAASAGYLGALTFYSWGKFHSAWVKGEVVLGVIDWPVSLSWIWVPLGCGLLSIRLILSALGPLISDGSGHT
ncbi:TRAP transporter small permease [Oricola sp.]|uniref:TRAP transporter small permease n=1 Tax=Oricola sp. TaxID=1979950 RepID=UPI0025DC914B|nr:TRAP transporter small permease [Oricola sp.]MCI5075399.1 TRAP transporter small permease [Oricola sp.]